MLDEERWEAQALESPFLEAFEPEERQSAPSAWGETTTPFEEVDSTLSATADANELLVQEAFAALRDEAFDEAVAFLAEETEQSIGARFTGETPANAAERERYGDAQLSPVRFEAEQYLDALEAGVSNLDFESLDEAQLETLLDRFDPPPGELTPAGEEFIGALVRKAKKAVKFVAKAAKGVVGGVLKGVGKVAGTLLGPVLGKLKKLINPLLKRVLGFAIGRLPAPLQSAARQLAARFTSEADEQEGWSGETTSPANLADLETLVESFDGAVAQALVGGDVDTEFETTAGEDPLGGRELERLGEARGVLIDRVAGACDGEELAPAVEEFVPALLGALKLGVNLIGRPKVVNFLAKFVAQLIGRFVGPQLSKPLSQAIVDTGLRLVMLEAEDGESSVTELEAGPTAVAGVIEDTVRRLAENEAYVFEDEGLMQLAAAEAFSHAVATHFPARFVRTSVQQAPSLGGTFVVRRPRSPRAFSKYSRVPEVAISSQMADALPGFGGTSMGAAMRAGGTRFPVRARMHIYQAAPGTTVERAIAADGGARGYRSTAHVYPLTPVAAATLLQEPALGNIVAPRYLRSSKQLAIGQRFFRLEALDASLEVPGGQAGRAAARRLRPSRAWCRIHRATGRVSVGFYLSEVDAQSVAEAARGGRGGPILLKLLTRLLATVGPAPSGGIAREDGEEFEEFAAHAAPVFAAALRRRLGAWILPALATWTRDNMEALVRAAAHPGAGVTLRVRLTGVPGLMPAPSRGATGALRGRPAVAIGVVPGHPGR